MGVEAERRWGLGLSEDQKYLYLNENAANNPVSKIKSLERGSNCSFTFKFINKPQATLSTGLFHFDNCSQAIVDFCTGEDNTDARGRVDFQKLASK